MEQEKINRLARGMPKPLNVMRPRERRHVTIVAGFRCYEGIVLCADTQETVAGLSKRNVPKLLFEPADWLDRTKALNSDDLAVAFCGAADNGPFVDKLVERAWEDAQLGSDLDEVCDLIEKSIKGVYMEFGEIYQQGYCPSADLIFGVKMFGSSKLFSATGPIVVEKKGYYSGGAGYYMADFLAGRMHNEDLNIRQCVILAAYILSQAKEHVSGCGGDSQIAILRNNGTSGRVDWVRMNAINKMLSHTDSEIGRLLLEATDLETSNQEFAESVDRIKIIVNSLRDIERSEYETRRIIHSTLPIGALSGDPNNDETVVIPVDEFGLPMPSDVQTLEDQQ